MKTEVKTLEEVYTLLKENKNTLDTKFPYSHKIKTNNKVINLELGRIWFNMILPDNIELINYPVDKKKMGVILKDVAELNSPEVAADTLTKLNKEAFKLSSINPVTFTSDSFNVPPELQKRKKELLNNKQNPEEFSSNLKILGSEYLSYLKTNNNGLYNIIKGVGKYSEMDLGVMLFAKGPVTDIEGNISSPILDCLNDGLNLENFYKSADQSRSVLFIRSMG